MKRALIAAAAILFFAQTASQASTVVTYDEAVNGDLNGSQKFTFGAGDNVVRGTKQFGRPSSDPQDAFLFDINSTSTVTGISIKYLSITYENIEWYSSGFVLLKDNFFYGNALEEIVIGGVPVSLPLTKSYSTLNAPLSAGSYTWYKGDGGTEIPYGGDFNVLLSYEITFTLSGISDQPVGWVVLPPSPPPPLSPVPIPASLPLLAASLVGLGMIRRRRVR